MKCHEEIQHKMQFFHHIVFLCHLFNIKIASFNCHGIGSSINDIRHLTEKFEILMLQETWLYPDEYGTVSQIRK